MHRISLKFDRPTWPNEKTSWVVLYDDVTNPRWRTGRHVGFQCWAIISASINIFAQNLVQWWKISSQCSEIWFSKIQDGGRPPYSISISGHNFGIDQYFVPNLVQWWKIGSQRGPSAKKSETCLTLLFLRATTSRLRCGVRRYLLVAARSLLLLW